MQDAHQSGEGGSWWARYTRWTDRLYLSIRARILISYFLLLLAAATYLINRMWKDVRPYYREAQEEVMVDAAYLLASIAAGQWGSSGPDLPGLQSAFASLREQRFSAPIYEMEKTQADLYAYVTDASGKVLFNTLDGEAVGSDYSQWNDVLRTLRGEYGARTTHLALNGVESSVIFVGAPIIVGGKTVGVFTLAKPTSSMQGYLERTRRRILFLGIGAAAGVAIVGALLSAWITYPIRNLIDYAQAVRDGRPARLPYLGHSEMRSLGHAFEEMRDALEGKDYVHRYVQTLTHELKSPVAAIRGAAELLEEEMPTADRQRFLKNIHSEVARIQEAIDNLLLLASVETRKALERVSRIDLRELAAKACSQLAHRARLKGITILPELAEGEGSGASSAMMVEGDAFLLERAIAGLLENAIDFSPAGSSVHLHLSAAGSGAIRLIISDSGSGIPDYAMERIFERFYSLPRPDTGRKSSGLGLALIREIVLLHGGRISLANREHGGVDAVLELPANSR